VMFLLLPTVETSAVVFHDSSITISIRH
jgi:hypothetical protein